MFLRESRDFAFDPAELEAAITPKTRLVILNTPHNPTGGILRAADLDAIAAILERHPRIWIYADEIYSRLAYDGKFESIATRPGLLERTVISDGASKTWAMTGWRIGFCANRALAPVFTRWITNTDSCARKSANGPRWKRSTVRRRQQMRALPRAARPDRGLAQQGSGHHVPLAGRGSTHGPTSPKGKG